LPELLTYLTPDILTYAAAFTIGLMGGAHCLGMCGGIMSALSFSVPDTEPRKRLRILLSYNVGRISSYTLIGALAGSLGYQVAGAGGVSVLRVLAALLLIAMGLYLADWWRGLTYLEKAGGSLWRRIQPLGKSLMPVRSGSAAFLLGGLWGWLPCGLVYTAVAYALAQADGWRAAMVMLAFGLGTLPAVLMGGLMAERTKALLQRRGFRLTMAIIIMTFGVWTLAAALQHAGHGQHTGMAHGAMNHEAMNHEAMNHETMDHETRSHEAMNKKTMGSTALGHSAMKHGTVDHSPRPVDAAEAVEVLGTPRPAKVDAHAHH